MVKDLYLGKYFVKEIQAPDADLLKGAGFSAYLKSSLEKKEDGS